MTLHFLLGKNLYNNEHVAIKLVSRNLLYICLLFKLSWRNTWWDILPLADGKYRIFFVDRNPWNLGHRSYIWNTDFIKYLEMLVRSRLVVHEYGKKKNFGVVARIWFRRAGSAKYIIVIHCISLTGCWWWETAKRKKIKPTSSLWFNFTFLIT